MGRSTKIALDFLIFALRLSYDLSKFSDDFFRLWKTITKSLAKKIENLNQGFVAMNLMNKVFQVS